MLVIRVRLLIMIGVLVILIYDQVTSFQLLLINFFAFFITNVPLHLLLGFIVGINCIIIQVLSCFSNQSVNSLIFWNFISLIQVSIFVRSFIEKVLIKL